VYIQAWVFIGIEVVVAIPPLLHNMWTMWAIKKRGRPKLRLIGENVPTVDVFVTCCGEDVDVIMDTVRAACYLDYPLDRFRVLLLDDGKDPELEEAMAKLSVLFPNVIYVARPKFPGVPHHFKAGNLNYGLDHVHTLPGGAGQFMAALDADMVCC
jgi:cellulose synthase/poly-beta-1,6-N-acetylglucosamine synthase-like glycosyltransferase